MSDAAAPTIINSDEGEMSFQEWFVARQWQPEVAEVRLPADIRATPQLMAVLEQADIVIIAPSNPFVSIEPILNVYPIRSMIMDLPKIVAAVSPIVGGEAIKGPAAKMMARFNLEVSARGIAGYYGDLIDLMIYDEKDAGPLDIPGLLEKQADTLMPTLHDRERLAREILDTVLELIEA